MRTLLAAGHELEHAIPGAVARRLILPALDATDGHQRRRLLRGLRPVLAPLLEGTPLLDEPEAEDPAGMLTSALATLFERAIGSEHVTLMLVDDAHWADPRSLRLLAYLLLAHEELPMALVLAVRSVGAASPALHALRASPLARVLRPRSLSADAVRQLVMTQLPRAEPAFCDLCARATAGNPFLLDAMLRSLRDDGLAGTAADAARVEAFVPDSVLSSALVRLARCSPAAASLARAVAVLGEAPLRQAGALAGLDALVADAAADELATAGFVRPGEPLGFTHPLVRASIYRDQTEFARARGHRDAAEILHAEGEGVEAVAAHLMLCRSERDPWVARTLGEAGQRALASGDPGTAAELLERALEEPPERDERADLLVALADARAGCGGPNAIEPLHQALDLIDDPRRRAAALHDLGILLLARHDLPGAATCARRGFAEITSGDELADALEGILLASAVLVPELHEQVDARIDELRVAALDGRDPRDPVTLAVVALQMIDHGDDREVVTRLARAAFAESVDRPAARAATINHLGSVLVYSEDLDQADELLTAAVTHAGARGRTVTGGFARVWRAQARLRCGRLQDAIADGEHALELRHFGWRFHVGPCLAVLVEARLERGDLPGAQAMLDIGEQTCDVPRQPLLLRARARVAVAVGDPAAAMADIRTADQFLRDTHDLDNPVILPWRTELARALARADRRDEAIELALEEADVARRFGSVRAEGIALATAGTIARDLAPLQRAVDLLKRTPAALERARALVELGATLRRHRERAAAREPLRHAMELATKLGAAPLAQRAQDELRATGARPRRVALEGVESLTATELRIAQLAASGCSNRQIADTLVVTVKTVEWHLGRIYGKLGVHGRHELDSFGLGEQLTAG